MLLSCAKHKLGDKLEGQNCSGRKKNKQGGTEAGGHLQIPKGNKQETWDRTVAATPTSNRETGKSGKYGDTLGKQLGRQDRAATAP